MRPTPPRLFPNLPQNPSPRFAPHRPWQPLSDHEWATLVPHLWRCHTPGTAGRPIEQPRRKLDAIFWLAAQDHRTRWRDLPEHFGKPDTIHRQFRRWAAQGLWTELLKALADRDYPGNAVLQRLASWICRAYRRAWRILGLAGLVLAKRLGLLSAQRGPSWLLPDPDLSAQLQPYLDEAVHRLGVTRDPPPKPWLRALNYLITSACGRRSIPRDLVWP